MYLLVRRQFASAFATCPSLRCSRARLRTMAWTCSADSHPALVAKLQTASLLRSTRAVDAMLRVDRACFTPNAYADEPQPLPCRATISAPHMHATAVELLHDVLAPGVAALDVGTGSGYFAAVMAVLVGPAGKVVAIEHAADLCALATRNLQAFDPDVIRNANVVVREADGRLGAPDMVWRACAFDIRFVYCCCICLLTLYFIACLGAVYGYPCWCCCTRGSASLVRPAGPARKDGHSSRHGRRYTIFAAYYKG